MDPSHRSPRPAETADPHGTPPYPLLAQVALQTADLIMLTDADGVVEYVNPAFERATGYAAAQVVGRSPAFMQSGTHGRDFYARLWQTISAGEVFHGVITNRRSDGSLYQEAKTITPLKDADGRISHYVSTGRDISELVAARDALQRHNQALEDIVVQRTLALQRAKETAEAVSESRARLLSRVSQRIRGPLHSLLGYARLGRERAGDDRTGRLGECFERIVFCSDIILGSIDELLDLGVIESEGLRLRREPLDLGALLEAVCQEKQAVCDARGIGLVSRIAVTPVQVHGDRERLRQALLGLAAHLLDRVEPGQEIVVRLQPGPDGFCRIHLGAHPAAAVTDGISEPPPVDNSPVMDAADAVGLNIAREIILAHGGDLWGPHPDTKTPVYGLRIPMTRRQP